MMNTSPPGYTAQKETPHQQGQGDKLIRQRKNSTQLVPLESASGIDFLDIESPGNPSTSGRFAYALKAKPVDLLKLPCTCGATGVCPVCNAWQSTMRLNGERGRARHGRD